MASKQDAKVPAAGLAPAPAAPRLVKAAEIVARDVARALPKPAPMNRPAMRSTRTPRSSAEARAIFDAMFREPARVGG